ncbi:hypothetical protein F7725_015339 [Dissostichus mawsoni]|uniref:Uncharacterized protein n=1 Tax=Dissostichus mawsoni TaxID=36200 RepID=A0A7J5YH58_DISMA|nr:hypothetical protein F7725_015339 [Dissostichus mawsoni]
MCEDMSKLSKSHGKMDHAGAFKQQSPCSSSDSLQSANPTETLSKIADSVLGDRPTSGFGSTVNSLSLASIVLQDDSLNVRSSFDAEISDLEHTVSEPPLPSACSSPVRMQESPFPTSSSSQECLVDLIQPVGRHKQVKRKRDSSSGLLVYLENSDDREEKLQERLQEQGQAMLKEQGQAMLQEVHAANAEFLRVFNRIEQNSHSMLGLVDRIVKRARDENFIDTVEAMEDRRAVVKELMHGDQMGLLSKAQETEDKMLTMMERQAEVLTRQMERQDEVSAQRHERQDELKAGTG